MKAKHVLLIVFSWFVSIAMVAVYPSQPSDNSGFWKQCGGEFIEGLSGILPMNIIPQRTSYLGNKKVEGQLITINGRDNKKIELQIVTYKKRISGDYILEMKSKNGAAIYYCSK